MAGVFAAAEAARACQASACQASERLGIGFIGLGERGKALLRTVQKLQSQTAGLAPVAICDVYTRAREEGVERSGSGAARPRGYVDYRDLLADPQVDAVCIATPDHWHGRMAIDALRAGKHVYLETPFTHKVAEAQEVLDVARETGRVVQVGVQRTSDGRWQAAHEYLTQGRLGKVLQAQSHYFRNSQSGQWRTQGLSREMSPRSIDWPRFLGTEFGLAPDLPFDRALFAQWRCSWAFSHGLYSELFVQKLTLLLQALGLRYPGRVTASGGIFLEYDGREVPDTGTLIADYAEGCQIVLLATMGNDYPIEECIRGHFGTLLFNLSRDGFDVRPERPQVTGLRELRAEHITATVPADETLAHWENFVHAVRASDPQLCHNPPDLAAAAVTTALLGAEGYRSGRIWGWDAEQRRPVAADAAWAAQWEARSRAQAPPTQIPGWQAGDHGSRLAPPSYQKLAGPWHNGLDPAI